MKLQQLAEVIGGIVTSAADQEPAAGTRHRVVQVKNIHDDGLDPTSELKTVFLRKERRAERYAIAEGDIIVALAGANPRAVVVRAVAPRTIAGNGVAIVRAKSASASNRVFRYLRSDVGRAKLAALSKGTASPRIKLADLATLPIPKD